MSPRLQCESMSSMAMPTSGMCLLYWILVNCERRHPRESSLIHTYPQQCALGRLSRQCGTPLWTSASSLTHSPCWSETGHMASLNPCRYPAFKLRGFESTYRVSTPSAFAEFAAVFTHISEFHTALPVHGNWMPGGHFWPPWQRQLYPYLENRCVQPFPALMAVSCYQISTA